MAKDANTIRSADASDVSLLATTIRRSFRDVALRFGLTPENCPKHPSNCTDQWIRKDLDRGVTYYVMECDGRAVGCVALERAKPDLCYLERLSVLPEARQKGLGRVLCEHAIAQAKGCGAKQLGLGMIAQDAGLKAWYGKIGFTEGKTRQFEHLPFKVTFMTYAL